MTDDQRPAQVITLVIILIIAISIIYGTYNLLRELPPASPRASTRSDHEIFFPNVMLASRSPVTSTAEQNELTVSGKILLLKPAAIDRESWSVWLSLDFGGETVISNIFTGMFIRGVDYPSPARRSNPIPYLQSNEGILLNGHEVFSNSFRLKAQVPNNICNLYLNYQSNVQRATPFYQINLCE